MHYGEPVEKHVKFQLWLYLSKFGKKGYNYHWEDGHGKIWMSGYSPGSRDEVARTARRNLDEEFTGDTE